jgi:AcrR family transcriptional regulator
MARRTADDVGSANSAMSARLLAAAKECFDHYGIEKTAMEDIARKAGVSRGTVYRYLGDRSGLITTVVMERAVGAFALARAVIAQQETFADQVVEGVLTLVEVARQDKYLRYLITPQTSYLAVSEKTVELNQELWIPVLENARTEGLLRDDLDPVDACIWFSQVQFMMVVRAEQLPAEPDELRRLLRIFLVPTLIPDSHFRP